MFMLIVIQYTNMARPKKSKNKGGFPDISPAGFVARMAEGDGRKKNPTKNLKRKYGGLF